MFRKIFQTLVEFLLLVQKRYTIIILLVGLILSGLAAPRAVKLLTSIKTDLINLLPDDYPSVHYTEEVQKKFNRRSSMYLILNSPDAEANKEAMFAVKKHIESLEEVGYIEVEKRGFDFFDRNKLLLIDLADIYAIHDRLKDKIQKRKLGGLYIDFESGDEKQKEVTFDDLVKKYQEQFTEGVRNRYKTNKDGTVWVLNIYPESTNAQLSYFKQFGEMIRAHVDKFDFSKYSPEIKTGYAGAIITRVDQYNALIDDLKTAGIISALSIFSLLYLYFGRFVDRGRTPLRFIFSFFIQAMPVIAIFIPMIMSTLLAFCFCSFFFDSLNVVTSFLFAIIFGLGVDIGIHLITRFKQDRVLGLDIETIHRDVVSRTGLSCAIGILTTVASFYILTINDFKGFSEFGWIAGNGLVIALACYLLFFPAILLLFDKWGLFWLKTPKSSQNAENGTNERQWFPYAKPLLTFLSTVTVVIAIAITSLPLVGVNVLDFEWDFTKLRLNLAHREHQKDLLEETHGRINSPAVYLVHNEVESREVKREIQKRKEQDTESPTIQFYRSFYDMVPFDQEEKLAVLGQIDTMLQDDALNTASKEEKRLITDFREAIKNTKRITPEMIPDDVKEIFWGNTGETVTSVAYIFPLPDLALGNGYIARDFYDDVHHITALGHEFYAISDAMVFAEVLKTLFRDSKTAIFLSALVIFVLIAWHFSNVKKTALIFIGLACGIFWMLGIMALFDFKMNFYNMIVIPALIGMGVDNSVHIMHRFDEVGRKSIFEVLKTSGGAALMASLTTILGYSGMCFTRHPGLESIGQMAIIGMSTCLVGSLLMLPLLLQVFNRARNKNSKK